MTPASPAAVIAAPGRNLAGSLEIRVGGAGTFLPIIDKNTPQIFDQFEKIQFV
jgi:hypothetical protein